MNDTALLLYCFIVTFTPGPTNIVILSTVHNQGVRKAINYTCGATAAFGLLLMASVFLNSLLVSVIPNVLTLMQVLGSGYMLYLAFQLYKSKSEDKNKPQLGNFRTGFLMQFLNPKVVIFTLTVIPTFVMPHDPSDLRLISTAAVITLIGFLAFMTWLLFGALFKEFLRRHDKLVNGLMAAFLVYSGIVIWI